MRVTKTPSKKSTGRTRKASRSRKAKENRGVGNGQGFQLPKTVTISGRTLTINREFETLLPPLTSEERTQLEQNIVEEGRIREPVVLWKGRDIPVDGHNRLAVALDHGMDVEFVEVEFADKQAVKNWIIDQHAGRRSLSELQLAFYRGKRYLSLKHSHGGNRRKGGSSDHSEHSTDNTAEKLAVQDGVSPATVRRDADFAKAVDAVIRNCGPAARDLLLSKESRLTRTQIIQLAGLKPAQQRRVVKQLGKGKRFTDVLKSLGITDQTSAEKQDPDAEESESRDTDGSLVDALFGEQMVPKIEETPVDKSPANEAVVDAALEPPAPEAKAEPAFSDPPPAQDAKSQAVDSGVTPLDRGTVLIGAMIVGVLKVVKILEVLQPVMNEVAPKMGDTPKRNVHTKLEDIANLAQQMMAVVEK